METKLEFYDLKNLLRRRQKSLILPFLIIFILALIISYKLPPIFLSESTIIVEGQQIPEDYLGTTPTSYVEERIETITRQIMSRTNLIKIIDKFNLYSKTEDKSSEFDILNHFKNDISLETIDANVHNRKSGREIITTIAFTISYQGNDPNTVQKVTNELASLYVEIDADGREKSAISTAKFLEVEMEELQNKIKKYEENISKFKSRHFDELPEHDAFNLQALANFEKEYDRLQIQLRALRNRKENLQKWKAGISPYKINVIDGKDILLHSKDRLRMLRIQLMDLKATLSDKHPDIKRLERLIKELEAEVDHVDTLALKKKRLKEIETKLNILKGTLSSKHPDVLKLQKEAQVIQMEINEEELSAKLLTANEAQPDNPSYLHLQSQIIGVNTEIQALNDQKQRTLKEIQAYREKIANAPLVEKDYFELTRDYETAKQRYREISDNVMKAKFAMEIDESQKTTRFKILEPAYFPQEPIKPNRNAIIILGAIIALISGFLFALLRENTDKSIKSSKELNHLSEIPVFAEIPFVELKKSARIKKLFFSCATFFVFFLSLWLVHRHITPLDILLDRYSETFIERFK
jgi:uncharacterized protein involved in exopolysaccharide biosynthesis